MANKYRKASIFSPMRLWKYLFKKPVSHPMDQIFTKKNAAYLNKNSITNPIDLDKTGPRPAPANLRGFHTNDWETCIGCSTCADICPTEAISMVERLDIKEQAGELQQRPIIDYGRCCFCALCVDTCTTSSLQMSNEYIYANTDPESFVFLPQDTWEGEQVDPGWTKDDTSDLLDLKRVEMDHVAPTERSESFVEVVRGFSKLQAQMEAARCVECGVCESSCPVQMNIPAYIKAIWENDIEAGLRLIYETNPLPGVCGRVCTHNCETSCAIAVRGEAIAIRWLKRYIIDSAPNDIYHKVVQEPVSEVIDAKVAVVGSGPAGLGAAYYLRTMGYDVDVFEAKPQTGGVMRYGIPAYRLPDSVIDKDIDFISSLGVSIHTSKRVGTDIKMDELESKYDAVFLGTGFFEPRDLHIPGADHEHVVGAMAFLPQVREYERGHLSLDEIHVGRDVVVIGGGDVAFDVARSVTRLQRLKYGKASVKLTSLENEDALPASDEEYIEGHEEGIEFFCGNGPQEVMIDKQNNVTGLRLWQCLCIFDDRGAFNPQFDNECEQIIEGDQIFIAIGQSPDYSYLPSELEKQLSFTRGKVEANEDGQITDVPWLFVGGDIFRGPDLISGVADGHRAATAIDAYLVNKASKVNWSTRMTELRQAAKETTPELTPKQRGIK